MHDKDDKRCVHAIRTILIDEAATLAYGAMLGSVLRVMIQELADVGMVIHLEGDLGAGKTTFVRGLLQSMGDAGRVKSPTYTFVEPYAISGLNLYHFDFYRFECADEFLDGGFDEYFGAGAVCLVEWPDKAKPHLPAADLRLALEVFGEGRKLVLEALTERGRRCLSNPLMNVFWLTPADVTSSGSLPPA